MSSNSTLGPIDSNVRIFGASSFLVLSTICLVLNVLLVILLIQSKGHREYKKNAFYILVWQLIICDLIDVVVQFLIAIPVTYAGFNMYKSLPVFIYSLTFIDSVSYTSLVVHSFLLTINRFTVFILPRLNEIIFEPPAIFGVIAASWLLSIAIYIFRTVVGINKNFLDTEFIWVNIYSRWLSDEENFINSFVRTCTYYAPYIMLGTYMLIILYLKIFRAKNSSTYAYRADVALIIQSFLICGSIALEMVAFKFIPGWKVTGQWQYILNFSQNWLTILLYTSNPVILYIFNTEIRNSLKRLLRKMKILKKVEPNTMNFITFTSNIRTVSTIRDAQRRWSTRTI